MNATLVSALLRQRLASPMRVVILAAMFLPGVAISLFMHSLVGVQGAGYFFTLVLAAGAIGQDVSSGVLHLTFARPVTRPSYVLSRWFAAAAGGFLLALARTLLTSALLALRGDAPSAQILGSTVLEDVIMAPVAAAVMVVFSSFVGGLGDVGLLVLASVGLNLVHNLAVWREWSVADRVALELQHTLKPELTFAWMAGHAGQSWSPYVTAFSTIAVALAIAIVILNRKELSYAAD